MNQWVNNEETNIYCHMIGQIEMYMINYISVADSDAVGSS